MNDNNCHANRRRRYSNDEVQQGRTESILWRPWLPLYGLCVTLEHSLQPARISCMLVFAERGKPQDPEKERLSEQSREPTQTQPTDNIYRISI